MALRNLVESQCGEVNPLMKVTQHLTRDKAHKEDRFYWHHLPQDEYNGVIENHKGLYETPVSLLVEEFMNETKNAATTTPQAFRMDALLQEMQEIERAPPLLGPGVAVLASEAGTWAQEYLDSERCIQDAEPIENWTKQFLEHQYEAQIPNRPMDLEAHWNQAASVMDSDIQSSKWAEEYDPQDDSELAKTANELLGTVDDPKFSNTEFMKYIHKLGSEGKAADSHDWHDEFFSMSPYNVADGWSEEFMNQSGMPYNISDQKHDNWNREYEEAVRKGNFNEVSIDSEAMNVKEKESFWQQLQENWEKAAKESKDVEHPWLAEFSEKYDEPFKDYIFKEENPLKNHPDPLSEGKKCLQMGDLPSAILLFEAAVQKDQNNSEAWLLLGATHAENEQDPSAIPALKKGVELDTSNLSGWMSLATSYTNESYQTQACLSLMEWIKNNKEYSHLIKKDAIFQRSKNFISSLAPRELLEEVQDLYIKAANSRPVEMLDCDVQCGLGTLLNLIGDYEKAIDCFQSAVQSKPTNPQLWNKLGATLANSNRSAEAVEAYRNALEISPGYIRCRYNLGIACMNLGAHREAMEHFLEALNMQETGRGVSNKGSSLTVSDNIWSTLKVCLRALNAQHLISAVNNRELEKLNEEFGTSSSS